MRSPCIADGCERPNHARKLCTMHYQQWKHGRLTIEAERVYQPRAAVCSIDGCGKMPAASDLCAMHYRRARIYGDAGEAAERKTGVMPEPLEDRFWRRTTRPSEDACWMFEGVPGSHGYMAIDKMVLAHRWSYERFIGPIPDGFHVDHLCRNRRCVNSRHLDAVTMAENLRRGRLTPEAHFALRLALVR